MMVRWKYLSAVLLLLGYFDTVLSKKIVLLDTKQSTSELQWVTHSLSSEPDVGWIEETFTQVTEGTNSRAYVVCEVDQPTVDNWLLTPWVQRGNAQRIYIEVRFTMRDCREFPGTARSCKETFTLLYHESDRELGAHELAWNEQTFKTIDRIAADQGRFSTKTESEVNVEVRSVEATSKGVYFAFRDQGACTSILAVKIYYELCEEIVSDLAWFGETPTGPDIHSIVEQTGRCQPHSSSKGAAPKFLCKADGSWDLRKGECLCDAGYWTSEEEQVCVACPKGRFKAGPGLGECETCPTNSFALEDGSSICTCDGGYYRADNDPDSAACTRPPSRPRSAQVLRVDQSSAFIDWEMPSSKGGRKEVWFRVECKDCPGSTQYSPGTPRLNGTQIGLSGLRPSAVYSVFIYSENEVSKQVDSLPMYSVVEFKTTELAPLHVLNFHTKMFTDTRVVLAWDPPEVPQDYHETAGDYPTPNNLGPVSPGTLVGMEPANLPDPIQSYQVRYYNKQVPVPETESKTVINTEAAFDGLTPDTRYAFQVRAYTSRGWGAWSDGLDVTTKEAGNDRPTYNSRPKNKPKTSSEKGDGDEKNKDQWPIYLLAGFGALAAVFVCGCCIYFLVRRSGMNKKQPSDLDVLDWRNDHPSTPDYSRFTLAGGTLVHNKFSSPLMTQYTPQAPMGYAGFKPYVDPTTYEDPNVALREYANEIDPVNIFIDTIIGKGEFGEVVKAKLKLPGRRDEYEWVAIKSLTNSCDKSNDFLAEASIMGQFDHPNVIRLIGVVTKQEPVMIITEYMEHRSLDKFLQTHELNLDLAQLVHMLRGIAAGMKYLSDKGYLHRDLAARNVLVTSRDGPITCKIADFGLSREGEGSVEQVYTTKGGKIPVRWTAPEAITHRKYTTASDVWSFGIVMWEVASYGDRPYYDWTNQEVIKQIDLGFRLPAPKDCPPGLHALMLECWNFDRHSRPSFSHILQRIDAFLRFPELLHASEASTTSSICAPTSGSLSSSASLGLDELLQSLGLTHCSALLSQHGVRTLEAVARLGLVDYLSYGLQQQEANRIRDALHNFYPSSTTLPRHAGLQGLQNGYHTMASIQPRQQHNEGFFV